MVHLRIQATCLNRTLEDKAGNMPKTLSIKNQISFDYIQYSRNKSTPTRCLAHGGISGYFESRCERMNAFTAAVSATASCNVMGSRMTAVTRAPGITAPSSCDGEGAVSKAA